MEAATCSTPFAQITGSIVYKVCHRVNTEQMNLHLQQISARLPESRHALIVLDNASWHRSKTLQVPDNVWLLHLPPYSPQLNSAENLFQYFKKTFIANRVFETTDILKEAVLDGLNKVAKGTDRIESVRKRLLPTLMNQIENSNECKTCSGG